MRSDLLVDEYSTYYAALEKADYDFQHVKRKNSSWFPEKCTKVTDSS